MSLPALDAYFPSDATRQPYSSRDLANIQQLLRNAENDRVKRWAPNPRLYTILRTIDELDNYGRLTADGITDEWLPLTSAVLNRLLAPEQSLPFKNAQTMVMTQASTFAHRLESGSVVPQHAHFDTEIALPLEDVNILGEGGYATVHLVKTKHAKHYAVKRFSRRQARNGKLILEGFLNEVQVMRRVEHHHCVKLMASYTSPNHYGLIMSPYAEYNLKEYYEHVLEDRHQRPILRTFFGCLANALAYLHQIAQIRHKDIKPANILVRNGKVFLADFGISHYWHDRGASTTAEDVRKSLMYCAPEVADPSFRKRNTSADVWSLGCVFLEMYTILKGRSIDQFRLHLGCNLHFRDLAAISTWLDYLERFDTTLDDDIIPVWIDRMLRDDPEERMSSGLLCEQILSAEKASGLSRPEYTCESCLVHVNATLAYRDAPSNADLRLDQRSIASSSPGNSDAPPHAVANEHSEECITPAEWRRVDIEHQRPRSSRSRSLELSRPNAQGQEYKDVTSLDHQTWRAAGHTPSYSADILRPKTHASRRLSAQRFPAHANLYDLQQRGPQHAHSEHAHSAHGSVSTVTLSPARTQTPCAGHSASLKVHAPEDANREIPYHYPKSQTYLQLSCRNDNGWHCLHNDHEPSTLRLMTPGAWPVHQNAKINTQWKDHGPLTSWPLPLQHTDRIARENSQSESQEITLSVPPGWILVNGTWVSTTQRSSVGQRLVKFVRGRGKSSEDVQLSRSAPKRHRGPWVKW